MIIELLFNLISLLVKAVFIFINLPPFPPSLASSIDTYLDLIFDNLSWLGFFVRPTTLGIVASTAVIVISFSRLYKVTVWIFNKLPINSK